MTRYSSAREALRQRGIVACVELEGGYLAFSGVEAARDFSNKTGGKVYARQYVGGSSLCPNGHPRSICRCVNH